MAEITIDADEVREALVELSARISFGEISDEVSDDLCRLVHRFPFELGIAPSSVTTGAGDGSVRFVILGIPEFCTAAMAALGADFLGHGVTP